jgi:hypothetical protein
MKPSEFGGSDTHKTDGIQPEPHVLTAPEKLRLMYKVNPADVAAEPARPLN